MGRIPVRPFWIPAFAGMTVGWRGNDGAGLGGMIWVRFRTLIPAYAGIQRNIRHAIVRGVF